MLNNRRHQIFCDSFFSSFHLSTRLSLTIYSAQFNRSYVSLYMHEHRSGCVNWIEWNEFFCRISEFVLFLVYSLAFICSFGKCCTNLSGLLIVIRSLRVPSALKWKTHVLCTTECQVRRKKAQPQPLGVRTELQTINVMLHGANNEQCYRFLVSASQRKHGISRWTNWFCFLLLLLSNVFCFEWHKCSWRCFWSAIVKSIFILY